MKWSSVAGVALVITLGLVPSLAGAQTGLPFGVGEHDGSQPVEITSDSLSVDQAANTATFRGSVIVGQGTLRLAAEEVLVQYGEGPEGSTEVEFIRASGFVTVTNGEEAAEAQEALYEVAAGTIEMTGDVIVTQGPNAVSGERLTIDLETGFANIAGRVQTILVPGQQPQVPGGGGAGQ